MMIRTYSELRRLATFEERYQYLRLGGLVGSSTFGFDRYLNQMLYKSARWLKARDEVIIRDHACDLGILDREIKTGILVHHMNPITVQDVVNECDYVFDPEFLITTILNTHNAIHFGDATKLFTLPKERRRNDTCPWL